jgi:hypothetical protein
MIQNTNIELDGTIVNPDTRAIQQKTMIDISLRVGDISASNYTSQIKLNYNNSEIMLLDDENSDNNDTYFTPLYTEKISYEVWKKTINKSFLELDIE